MKHNRLIAIEKKDSKPICSICCEDLKPVAEDRQAIFICGHVLHEHCLQQWFKYCLSSNKFACPVCNQMCKTTDASHLYFQSLEVLDDGEEEDPKKLREEVRRLQSKVEGLGSALESQGKDFKEIGKQVFPV